jgi:hypothetical protein
MIVRWLVVSGLALLPDNYQPSIDPGGSRSGVYDWASRRGA